MLRKELFGDSKLKQAKAVVKPPPADQYAIKHPELANIDNETIKLTAQLVAKNG